MRQIGITLMLVYASTVFFGLITDRFWWKGRVPDYFLALLLINSGLLVVGVALFIVGWVKS